MTQGFRFHYVNKRRRTLKLAIRVQKIRGKKIDKYFENVNPINLYHTLLCSPLWDWSGESTLRGGDDGRTANWATVALTTISLLLLLVTYAVSCRCGVPIDARVHRVSSERERELIGYPE